MGAPGSRSRTCRPGHPARRVEATAMRCRPVPGTRGGLGVQGQQRSGTCGTYGLIRRLPLCSSRSVADAGWAVCVVGKLEDWEPLV